VTYFYIHTLQADLQNPIQNIYTITYVQLAAQPLKLCGKRCSEGAFFCVVADTYLRALR